MSIRLFSLIACIALLGGAAPPQPDASLQGEWRNTNNSVHLRVQPCGNSLCGTVTWADQKQRAEARKGSGKDLVGSMLLRDLKRTGDGTWRGKVSILAINSSATATVTRVDAKTIRISGCALLGLACRTQHWHRL